MLSFAEFTDSTLERLKWPAALVSVIALPAVSLAFFHLLARCLGKLPEVLPLVIGCVGFVLLWRNFRWVSQVGHWIITFEHELTHAIFALITGHKVVGFRVSMRRTGRVKFVGKGNWLITVSPYFFPTSALFLVLFSWLMPIHQIPWTGLALGVAIGFHFISTAIETHRDQSDLQLLGKTFCWLFLPTANVLAVAFLIAIGHDGFNGVGLYLQDCWQPFMDLYSYLSGSAA